MKETRYNITSMVRQALPTGGAGPMVKLTREITGLTGHPFRDLLGVRRKEGERVWVLDHIPSGLAIYRVTSKAKARRLATLLVNNLEKWGHLEDFRKARPTPLTVSLVGKVLTAWEVDLRKATEPQEEETPAQPVTA